VVEIGPLKGAEEDRCLVESTVFFKTVLLQEAIVVFLEFRRVKKRLMGW
jgi:hypothetical protein